MDKLAQGAVSQLEAAVASCRSGDIDEATCMSLCAKMGDLLSIAGNDENEALRAGIASAEPFFVDVVEGRVRVADDAAVRPLAFGMALLAELHWSTTGGHGRRACIDVVEERAHRDKTPSSFMWVGPPGARIETGPPEDLDSTLLVFRNHRLRAHELRLCTDFTLDSNQKLHVWVEKRALFGKGALTLDEAMCLSHVYCFEGIDEKVREIERALTSKRDAETSQRGDVSDE